MSKSLTKERDMEPIVNLIIYLVIFGLIWWLVSLLPLPSPVAQIVRVLFIILLILIVLSAFGILPAGILPHKKTPASINRGGCFLLPPQFFISLTI
jgi:hypothetical protein